MIQIIVISNISNSQLSLKKRTISISLRIIKPTIIPNLRNISNKSSPIHITTSQKSCKSPKSKILAILLSSLNRFPPTTPFPSSHKQDRDTFPLATWARYRELWDTRWLRGGVVQGQASTCSSVDTKGEAASSWCRSVSGYISSWVDSAKYVFPPSGPGWHAMRYVKKCS